METRFLDETIKILRKILDYLKRDQAKILLDEVEKRTRTSVDQAWNLKPFELADEVKDNLRTAKESTLQDRYANYVIDNLIEYVHPLISLAKKESDKYDIESLHPLPLDHGKRSDHQNEILRWISLYGMLYEQVSYIEASVTDLLRCFAPNHFEYYFQKYGTDENALFKLIEPIKLIITDPSLPSISADPHIQPIEVNVKLQWNGTNRALYDLFAQLSLINGKHNRPLIGNTIAGISQFLSKNVEGLPDAATVERELQKMREPHGTERAKRDRIDINITKDDR